MTRSRMLLVGAVTATREELPPYLGTQKGSPALTS
jgi:hypothetical protein